MYAIIRYSEIISRNIFYLAAKGIEKEKGDFFLNSWKTTQKKGST